jgi:hypothetical protein
MYGIASSHSSQSTITGRFITGQSARQIFTVETRKMYFIKRIKKAIVTNFKFIKNSIRRSKYLIKKAK